MGYYINISNYFISVFKLPRKSVINRSDVIDIAQIRGRLPPRRNVQLPIIFSDERYDALLSEYSKLKS